MEVGLFMMRAIGIKYESIEKAVDALYKYLEILDDKNNKADTV